jgi:hypothetical protein
VSLGLGWAELWLLEPQLEQVHTRKERVHTRKELNHNLSVQSFLGLEYQQVLGVHRLKGRVHIQQELKELALGPQQEQTRRQGQEVRKMKELKLEL